MSLITHDTNHIHVQGNIKYLMQPMLRVFALLTFCMNAQQLEQNDAHLQIATGRIPPSWSPEQDKRYPYRLWMQDVQLWCAATDIPEERQAAVVALRVLGSAKSIVREIPPNLLIQGQDVPDPNPALAAQGAMVHQTGLEVLLRSLNRRYGLLEQEVQINSISELFTFRKLSGETTDDVLSRFELTMHKAQAQGGVVMNEPAKAWMLLTTLNIHKDKWFLLLSPTQGALPNTPAQYADFTRYLRRQGHLMDSGFQDPAKTLRQPTFFHGVHDDTHETHETSYDAWHGAYPSYPYESPDESTDVGDDDEYMSEASSGHSHASEYVDLSDIMDMEPVQAAEHLYLAYRFHKRRFRKFTGQRGGRGAKGRGKGRRKFFRFTRSKGGKGKGASAFINISEDYNSAIETAFFGGKGKGKGGKRKNPIGPDGKIMTCSGCGSEDHFVKHCPKARTQQTGRSSTSNAASSSGYLSQATAAPSAHPLTAPQEVPGHRRFYHVASMPNDDEHTSMNRIVYADGTEELFAFHASDQHFPAVHQDPHDSSLRSWLGFFVRKIESIFPVWLSPFFHAQVRRSQGEGLLIDTGAIGPLTGDRTFSRISAYAKKAGQGTHFEAIPHHEVDGVGSKPSSVDTKGKTAVCLRDGTVCEFVSNVMKDSDLPALYGLEGLHRNRSLIDVCSKKLIFVGAGGYTLQLSPGSRTYALESVPSGHLLLPCTEWANAKTTAKTLSLF